MSLDVDVVVVGGGVIGLTAALAMGELGFTVTLLETKKLSSSPIGMNLRVYAVNPASQRLLERLTIWQQVASANLSPYQHMHVWDAETKASIDFDCRMIASTHLGHIIEESVLKKALLERINTHPHIQLYDESPVQALKQQALGMQVITSTQQWQAKLLIIADGAHSPCRELLQIPLSTYSYRQQAIVAQVQTEKPHQKTAYQVFNPDGPLAFLPLREATQSSIVWSTTPARADKLIALSDSAFNAELSKAFDYHLGETTLQSARQQFPLNMRHTKQYSGANWLLLGDAAHTIHPLAGLGLNIGLADLAVWEEYLVQAKLNLSSPKALGAYQRQRKYEVWKVIALMDGFKTLFGSSFFPLIKLRGWGLSLSNRSLLLKKLFIEQAAGQRK